MPALLLVACDRSTRAIRIPHNRGNIQATAHITLRVLSKKITLIGSGLSLIYTISSVISYVSNDPF